MLTGVVLARNEELNIAACLQNLRPHVDELILIDMESADRTVELAQPFVDRVLDHPLIPNFDSARNIAIDTARNDWLWFVDADERVSPSLATTVKAFITERGNDFEALTIPFKSYFCGQWMQHCGWWPGYTMPRVLKKGHFRFAERLHGGVELQGREARLAPDPNLAVAHFSYRSIEHYLDKCNQYTTTEANELRSNGVEWDWRRALSHFVQDLWIYYERNRGHEDGARGWILSWLSGTYRWLSHAKLIDNAQSPIIKGDPRSCPASLDEAVRFIDMELTKLRRATPQLPLGVVWRSPIWDCSGYADDARSMLCALARSWRQTSFDDASWNGTPCRMLPSVDALIRALARARRPSSALTITQTIPTFAEPDPLAVCNVLRTTFETDRIPAHWHPRLANFDEIWVFATHNARAFRRSGVPPEKIRVVPSCIDTALFSPIGHRLPLPPALAGRFVFLSVFDWAYRKGWDVLLRAYCEEFTVDERKGLLLKITHNHGHSLELIAKQANELLASIGTSLEERSDVYILDAILDVEEMPALYRSADAFVLASRGEGWGRPYMEAMACGLPTIGSGATGNLDFMTDENSVLIAGRYMPVSEEGVREITIYAGHHWFEPDVEDLRRKLRLVAGDRQLSAALAQRAIVDIRANFDLAAGARNLEAAIGAVEARFQPTNLPECASGQVRVVLEGELLAGHSFANVNASLLHSLGNDSTIFLGFDRKFHTPADDCEHDAHELLAFVGRGGDAPPDVTVRHAYPPNWSRPAAGKWVHIQPWEFGHLPRAWLQPLMDVDEVWAPSDYVRQVYVRSGIPDWKVQVIPWGIAPDVFYPEVPALHLPTSKSFRFLFVGGTIRRKGFDRVLNAYLSEFTEDDDVCLVIKDMGADSFYRFENMRSDIMQASRQRSAPSILYLDQKMTAGQMASLYAATHVLVAPYRGEGFCLPVLEAMAVGVCPIVPRGGPTDDFVPDGCGYLLESWECATPDDSLCGPRLELELDAQELAAQMRWCYQHPDICRLKGRRASHLAARYTWDRTASVMRERIHALMR